MGFFDWLLGRKRERPGEAEVAPRDEQSREAEEQQRHDLPGCRLETLTNSIGMKLQRIPAGSFVMGSSKGDDSEKPLHKVTLARPFYMGMYPVTQAEWERVMGNNPSHFKGPNRPVECVSWEMAQEFCRKLSEMEGLVYRLPSEAEWEYACRAGTTTEYCFGDSDANLGDYAWFKGNSGGQTHDVGQKKPNAWGLFDMHGNVWEWCEDLWHDNYRGAPDDGSAWVEGGSAESRGVRGGSGSHAPALLRSALRLRLTPDARLSDLGFRVVRAPGPR